MKHITFHNKTLMIAMLAISACANSVKANEQENYLRLSEKLVELRGQVNDLSNELQQRRDEHNIEMKGLLSQKSTMDSSIKHEKVAIADLQEGLLKNKQIIEEIGADKETIKQALLSETEKLKVHVKTGLPFKVEERLRSIEDYETSLKAGVLSSHKAANTLWSIIEDELKLARDNGVYRHSITIDDKEHLAHVVKLGMVMMYFRIGDEEYGLFRKNGDRWIAEVRQGSKDIAQIKNLFSSVEKQIHVGYFELPNAL